MWLPVIYIWWKSTINCEGGFRGMGFWNLIWCLHSPSPSKHCRIQLIYDWRSAKEAGNLTYKEGSDAWSWFMFQSMPKDHKWAPLNPWKQSMQNFVTKPCFMLALLQWRIFCLWRFHAHECSWHKLHSNLLLTRWVLLFEASHGKIFWFQVWQTQNGTTLSMLTNKKWGWA